MLLTFLSSIHADFNRILHIGKRPWLFICLMLVLHLLMPLAVYPAAQQLFPEQEQLALGITLITLLPLGVTSIFWVSYSRANMETVLSFVTMNTLLSPLLVPLTFLWVIGAEVQLSAGALIISLMKLVLVPTILGIFFGSWLRRRDALAKAQQGASFASKLLLYMIVLLNAASVSEQLVSIQESLAALLLAVFAVMLLGYALSSLLAHSLTKSRDIRIAAAYAGGIRNYTVGVVLAASFFTPAAGVPVLLAMLLQHPVALMFYYLFKRWN